MCRSRCQDFKKLVNQIDDGFASWNVWAGGIALLGKSVSVGCCRAIELRAVYVPTVTTCNQVTATNSVHFARKCYSQAANERASEPASEAGSKPAHHSHDANHL